jgi:hypothetical protein
MKQNMKSQDKKAKNMGLLQCRSFVHQAVLIETCYDPGKIWGEQGFLRVWPL